MPEEDAPVTLLLRAWAQGDRDAFDRLTPVVYDELHRLAGIYMRRERRDHTLSPTALVSEAFLRLVEGQHPVYEDRVQFFAVAAHHMRRILVDHARRRTARKRGGHDRPVPFDEELIPGDRPEELVALDEALDALEANHAFLTRGGVFTEDLIRTYVEFRREQSDRVKIRPHPYEFPMYFDG
jgi:RNA polymerase sigma-70 factor, ECF subfamily